MTPAAGRADLEQAVPRLHGDHAGVSAQPVRGAAGRAFARERDRDRPGDADRSGLDRHERELGVIERDVKASVRRSGERRRRGARGQAVGVETVAPRGRSDSGMRRSERL
jgi:hypothetical protein